MTWEWWSDWCDHESDSCIKSDNQSGIETVDFESIFHLIPVITPSPDNHILRERNRICKDRKREKRLVVVLEKPYLVDVQKFHQILFGLWVQRLIDSNVDVPLNAGKLIRLPWFLQRRRPVTISEDIVSTWNQWQWCPKKVLQYWVPSLTCR